MPPTSASTHSVRFPGESDAYRAARNTLLDAEIDLRRRTEAVAAMRRALPPGGALKENYTFDADGNKRVRFEELFGRGKDTLIVYSFMFGPQMAQACPLCTSILDALDGEVPHVVPRVNLAVVAKSPIDRIMTYARSRGWHNLPLLSSANNTYNADYHGETSNGSQQPALNVFVRRNGRMHHSYCTELLFAPADPGQDARHVDPIWPLWNLFDYTPEGRGETWRPRLSY